MAKKAGISREKYKNIKRMDHKQMEQFVINLYNEAYNDGKAAAGLKMINLSDVAAAVTEIKGIGTKKVAEIVEAINKLYEGGTAC